MRNSRAILSLLAMFFAAMATLALAASGDRTILTPAIIDYRGTQYLIFALALVSVASWYLTFIKQRGFKYLVSSRVLLSALSGTFGASVTLFVVAYVAPSDFRSALISSWQLCAYSGAAMLAGSIWVAIYHRSLIYAGQCRAPADSTS